MSGVPDRAARGAHAAHDGAECAVASGLASGDLGHDSQFSEGRNFAHSLDFNSPRRYNDATRAHEDRRTDPAADASNGRRLASSFGGTPWIHN